jgi:hypothetical protein
VFAGYTPGNEYQFEDESMNYGGALEARYFCKRLDGDAESIASNVITQPGTFVE